MSHHSKWSLAIILNDLYCSFPLLSTLKKFPITWTFLGKKSEFRGIGVKVAKIQSVKIGKYTKKNKSWREIPSGSRMVYVVYRIYTDLVFFSLFIVKARRWLAQINATVPSSSSPLPRIAQVKWRNDGGETRTQQLRNLWDSIFYNDHSHYHK